MLCSDHSCTKDLTIHPMQVATDRSVCESLPPVFQELWQQWEGQGGGAPEVDATSTTERAEFAALLASQARIRNGSRKSKAEASGADQCRQPGGKGGARVLQVSSDVDLLDILANCPEFLYLPI